MKFLRLIFGNALRHKLRTGLTVFGLAIAVMAFSVIRATIDAWYSNAEASSPNRLITINAVSLVFTLPMTYKDKIAKIPGVTGISWAQWFGATYIDPRNFFMQFAVDHTTYFDLYPEMLIAGGEMEQFNKQRTAAIVGRQLADRFGWSLGDHISLIGTIFPGDWEFVIRGIYIGAEDVTDESRFFFRYDYLDERLRQETPARAGQVGSFIARIADPTQAAAISDQIDAVFENSLAETRTETEEAFQLSFVAMMGSVITGLRIISGLVIGIILLVLANTMAMTARERISEYAVMKTLGFRKHHIVGLILGESLLIGIVGGLFGLLITFPAADLMRAANQGMLRVAVSPSTLLLGMAASVVVGILAGLFPAAKAVRTPIVDGLRIID